jgi:hypothetical protein
MRQVAEADRIRRLMHALGGAAGEECRIYFTGGASAVLLGWRASTIDVDLSVAPDRDDVLRAFPRLKEDLQLNIELAAPTDFLPPLPAWQERSPFIAREGKVSFHHFDFYSQALAKIERGHAQDRLDVESMLRARLIEPARLRELFEDILPELYRYPAVDPESFQRALEEALREPR